MRRVTDVGKVPAKGQNNDLDENMLDFNIKDQIYLLSLLILFVGIVSLDTYYQTFNIKYQTLCLPASHIAFRGMTAIFTNWYILAVYAVSALWLVFQKAIVLIVSRKQVFLSGILPYLFIGFVIAANYPLAIHSGKEAAKLDMYEETCNLPRIISIARKSCNSPTRDCTFNGARLLLYDGSYLILFWPMEKGKNSDVLNIHRLAKEDANVIKTTAK